MRGEEFTSFFNKVLLPVADPEDARETPSIIKEEFKRHGISITSKTDYSKDAVKAIIEESKKGGIDTIIIRPRIASRLTKFIAGDILDKLMDKSEIPLVILHHKG